jgi:hypothetical protein
VNKLPKLIRTVASAEAQVPASPPAQKPTPERVVKLEIQELEARQTPTMIWGEGPSI